MWSVESGVQSSTVRYCVDALLYKAVLRGVPDVPSKNVQQERLTRVFQSTERDCFTRVCDKSVRRRSVSQECPIKVPQKWPTEYATRASQKKSHMIGRKECQARVFCKSGF